MLHKLRAGRQLTDLDLQEMERILTKSGGFTPAELAGGAEEAHGLGLLIRSVVGMERSAAAAARSAFVADANLTGNQHAFVDLIIYQLTARGAVSIELLYEEPFTDYAPMGPDGLFTGAQATQLLSVLDRSDRRSGVRRQGSDFTNSDGFSYGMTKGRQVAAVSAADDTRTPVSRQLCPVSTRSSMGSLKLRRHKKQSRYE